MGRVQQSGSWGTFANIFHQQADLNGQTDDVTAVVIKPNKEVPSDSLQNPSDPEAGYCGHKGKGYQMQVMKTWSEDKSQLNLITHVKVEADHESDAHALLPAIKDAAQRNLAPVEQLPHQLPLQFQTCGLMQSYLLSSVAVNVLSLRPSRPGGAFNMIVRISTHVPSAFVHVQTWSLIPRSPQYVIFNNQSGGHEKPLSFRAFFPASHKPNAGFIVKCRPRSRFWTFTCPYTPEIYGLWL